MCVCVGWTTHFAIINLLHIVLEAFLQVTATFVGQLVALCVCVCVGPALFWVEVWVFEAKCLVVVKPLPPDGGVKDE